MTKSSPIALRARLWIGKSLAAMFLYMLLAACRQTLEGPGFQETEAVNSLKAIDTAEIQYQSTYPAIGFSCSLHDLGGDPNQGSPSPTSAQLLQSDLPTGSNAGYLFKIGNCTKARVHDVDVITGYTATAVPQKIGKTGNRGFCLNQFNELKMDPSGGTNCTEHVD
jgi:type IV pilus assembly protein PilA